MRAAFDQVLALHRAHCKKLADRKGRPVNEWTAEQLLQQVREEFGGGLLDARTATKVTTAFERAGVTGADLATAAEPEAATTAANKQQGARVGARPPADTASANAVVNALDDAIATRAAECSRELRFNSAPETPKKTGTRA